jgi:hypothetical protein
VVSELGFMSVDHSTHLRINRLYGTTAPKPFRAEFQLLAFCDSSCFSHVRTLNRTTYILDSCFTCLFDSLSRRVLRCWLFGMSVISGSPVYICLILGPILGGNSGGRVPDNMIICVQKNYLKPALFLKGIQSDKLILRCTSIIISNRANVLIFHSRRSIRNASLLSHDQIYGMAETPPNARAHLSSMSSASSWVHLDLRILLPSATRNSCARSSNSKKCSRNQRG